MTDNARKYWAFLSFSHQDNREQRSNTQNVSSRCWGNWLHDALQAFPIPAEFVSQINGRGEIIPERIHPIYRDEPERPDDASLSADMRKALEQSICLIVVCSPRSAKSLHVNEAVRYFKQLGRGNQHILPIVVAGEPNASDGNTPGFSPEDECFVPALRHPVSPDGSVDTTRRAGRHIFVDARHGVEKREILGTDHRHAEADLEMAKIQLIALLIGVGFNGLWWREQKRHFCDLAEAQHQAREALKQVVEARRHLEEAQRQTHEAKQQALETQNLPRDVHGQIQEAQSQALAAQNQAREAQKQLQEVQNIVRDTQAQLEESRQRALAAESKALDAQNEAREAQNQVAEARQQARSAQDQVLEIQNRPQDVPPRNQDDQELARTTQSQLEAARNQALDAHNQFLAAQSQAREFQQQAQSAERQLEAARHQVREAQSKVLETEKQALAAQNQGRAIQNQGRNAQRLTKVFALLAVLALITAGIAASMAWRQRKVASQVAAGAAADSAGKFNPAPGGLDSATIGQVLRNMGGAEQEENRRRSLEALAASIPLSEIPPALQASSVIANDQQRSHFQKWLLVRLGWANPVSAMTCAGAIGDKIVNDEGGSDSGLYFQLAVLDNWLPTDLPGALSWACQLPAADARQRAMDTTIHWLKSQPDSESKNQALATCIEALAKTDVPGALALAESLPDGAWRSAVLARLWIRTDSLAAWGWINSLDLLAETTPPQKTAWPWAPLLLKSHFVSPIRLPDESELLLNSTNAAFPTQP